MANIIDFDTINEEFNPEKQILSCECNDEEKEEVIDNINGVNICATCGTILDNIIDTSAEWRYYGGEDTNDSDPTRCGNLVNPLLPQSSLATYIGGTFNKKFSSIKRIHKWNAMPTDERSRWTVFTYINEKTTHKEISKKIIDLCKFYYTKLTEKTYDSSVIYKDLTRGLVRKGLISACLWYSCKMNKKQRSINEIAEIFEIESTEVTRGIRKFVELCRNKNIDISITASNYEDFIEYFCDRLKISKKKMKLSKIIGRRAKKIKIVDDNTPPSIAASSIYLVCKFFEYPINKKHITSQCDVSDVTLTKCIKKMTEYKDKLFIGINKNI
jgi:transcription initiation factor TFIIB